MAGFRIGRGRDPRSPQQQPGGGQYGGQPGPSPYQGGAPYSGGHGPGSAYGGQPWPPAGPPDEPEYFGQTGVHPGGRGPRHDDPGHTRAFTMGEDPAGYDPNAGGYGPDDYDPDPHVATYQAGQTAGPPAGPRLHWKQLLTGVVLRPQQTYLQMRDYQVWAPALTVTFIYGLFLTLFGFTKEGEENVFLSSSLSASIPGLLFGAVSVMIGMLMLGAVSNALARQLGGDGIWAPTIGLAMLITTLTDIPRLLFAAFLHTDNNLVQVIGWFTLALGGALLTLMVSKSHDLPWPRALGACSIQLVALFVLHTLPAAGG